MASVRTPAKCALVLAGGGAHAAYHAGVLKAIRELLPDARRNPFPILCGTSGGAINAALLASSAADFGAAVDRLAAFWDELHCADVYAARIPAYVAAAGRWSAALAAAWLVADGSRPFLDNGPLRQRLTGRMDFGGIEAAIGEHALHALSITCSGYGSGQSVSFFQGRADLEPWRSGQRVGAHVKLDVDHLLASSAIPLIFPAVRLHREWFGDGALRQPAPISPAVHLGAERILVVAPGLAAAADVPREESAGRPSLAQIAGHALSGLYADNLAMDVQGATRINHSLALLPPEARQAQGLRSLDILAIQSSQRLDRLAAGYLHLLPRTVRRLLAGIGGLDAEGGALASFLLFEPAYTMALARLGYEDAQAHREALRRLLGLDGYST